MIYQYLSLNDVTSFQALSCFPHLCYLARGCSASTAGQGYCIGDRHYLPHPQIFSRNGLRIISANYTGISRDAGSVISLVVIISVSVAIVHVFLLIGYTYVLSMSHLVL